MNTIYSTLEIFPLKAFAYRVRQFSPVKLALHVNGFSANVTPRWSHTCITFRAAGYQALIYLTHKSEKQKEKNTNKITVRSTTKQKWERTWNSLPCCLGAAPEMTWQGSVPCSEHPEWNGLTASARCLLSPSPWNPCWQPPVETAHQQAPWKFSQPPEIIIDFTMIWAAGRFVCPHSSCYWQGGTSRYYFPLSNLHTPPTHTNHKF